MNHPNNDILAKKATEKQPTAFIIYLRESLDSLAGKVIAEQVLLSRGYAVTNVAVPSPCGGPSSYDYIIYIGVCPTLDDLKAACKANGVVLVIDYHEQATLHTPWPELHRSYDNLTANVSAAYGAAMLTWHWFASDKLVPTALHLLSDKVMEHKDSAAFMKGMSLMTWHEQAMLLQVQFFTAYPTRHPARLDVIAQGEKAMYAEQFSQPCDSPGQEPKTGCKNNCERCKRVQKVQS